MLVGRPDRLDGRVRNAPGFSDTDGFDPDEFGLAELRLVNWHGWLFTDPSGEDADFTSWNGTVQP